MGKQTSGLKLFPNHPAWARPGARLVKRSYLTVTCSTSGGLWAKDDKGNPTWVPLDHLRSVWTPLRRRGLRKKVTT